ncbi:Nuclear export mediator factor NEMF homolog [Gryllus bimaculatus]|nr:Nuclear export mediator factor NEMF homolog [Gryllus bimaculatus]
MHTTDFEWPKNVAPSGFLMKVCLSTLLKLLIFLTPLKSEFIVIQMNLSLIGMRVAQVYDIDHKTYLIKLQRTEEKCVLLLESGSRMHTTGFEWPKNVAPSGFSMKMRKHLRNKRLESMKQLGIDRVVDLQFGSGEAAYHIILELYDRGNIILTDCDLTILNVLRPHTEGEEVRFAVREKYPLDRAHQRKVLSQEEVEALLATAKPGDNIKNILNRNTEYGPAILEHILLGAGFAANCKLGKSFHGYIVQKRDRRPLADGGEEDFFSNQEFHPMVFQQHTNSPLREFESFDAAVDEFFSTLESQKIDMKALQQEKEALKKLENVRKDHSQRLVALEQTQEVDRRRAELITMNQQLVDHVVMAVRAMVASQASWPDIEEMVKAAQAQGDPVACLIHELKLSVNHVALKLSDPYADTYEDDDDDDDDDDDGEDKDKKEDSAKSMIIDIDLDLTAFANARKYYDQKRSAAKKQQKTIDAQTKAFKSAEKKTKQTLKEVQAITHINKARKVFWFEKFHWFISSENYLVIGGRDPQQNELIVKRYLRAGDVYVHADIQGASSIVIKNPSNQPIPPKTLNEAGIMAMSYSLQIVFVSKTAPTGEYLTTGAFMIRGKKNYLPHSHLIMGFSFLFKLEESSIERHKDDRKVRTHEEDTISSVGSTLDNMSLLSEQEQDQEIELEDSDEENDDGNEGSNEKCNEEGTGSVENEEKDRPASPNSNSQKDSLRESRDQSPDVESDSAEEDSSHDAVKEEKEVEFPDVELKIQHTGTAVTLEVPTTPILLAKEEPEGDQSTVVLFVSENEMNKRNQGKHEQPQQQQQQLKRGQKGKLKKMKEKYKNQDDEDRELMMKILKPEGSSKESKDKGKKKGKEQGKGQGQRQQVVRKPRPVQPPKAQVEGEAGEDSDGGEEERVPAAEVDMLDSLTGQPVTEDELLFAVPVVAPYSTLHNYKFKVKLTPGTGKRGKAAKTAMNMFLKDRNTTPRERDLIKSVKDEDLARNLPGKVKVSAPQLQKLKR